MLQVSVDFREEVDELHGFLQTLSPEDWDRETGFMQWTTWDVVAHLHYFDLVSMPALEGKEAFAKEREALIAAVGQHEADAAGSHLGVIVHVVKPAPQHVRVRQNGVGIQQ